MEPLKGITHFEYDKESVVAKDYNYQLEVLSCLPDKYNNLVTCYNVSLPECPRKFMLHVRPIVYKKNWTMNFTVLNHGRTHGSRFKLTGKDNKHFQMRGVTDVSLHDIKGKFNMTIECENCFILWEYTGKGINKGDINN